MVFNDELQQQISRSQTFMFIGYLPFLSVAFHFLFAAPSKASIRYPNTNYEVWYNNYFGLDSRQFYSLYATGVVDSL